MRLLSSSGHVNDLILGKRSRLRSVGGIQQNWRACAAQWGWKSYNCKYLLTYVVPRGCLWVGEDYLEVLPPPTYVVGIGISGRNEFL